MLFRTSPKQCNKSHITDEELVSQFVRTRQNDLLGQLYTKCYDRIYHQCQAMVRDPVLAQDYTHDIFLKIISKLSTFKHNSRFSSWLSTVTYNHCLDQFRNSKNRAEISIENYPELAGDDPWIHYLQNEPSQLDWLMLAISGLPVEEQMILDMHYAQNLNLRAISIKFNITISATKMRLLRSRKRLRDGYYKGKPEPVGRIDHQRYFSSDSDSTPTAKTHK